MNSFYDWNVKPCWDYEGKKCEAYFNSAFSFKTTGASPQLVFPTLNSSDIPIPIKLDWQDVSGAGSYKYEVSSDSSFSNKVDAGIVESSEALTDYPKVKMLTDYWWHVRTCADKEGSTCGAWSNPQKFRTFKLSSPADSLPKNDEEVFTYEMPKTFFWDKVPYARYYQYTINYILKSAEEKSDCPLGKVMENIVANNSDLVSLNCLGQYQWQIQTCLDKDCLEKGDMKVGKFTLTQKEIQGKGGLVPCGRTYDDPTTPWNERDTCQFKHLFLLLKNILDFLLWRVSLIILVLLILAIGALYYFSFGDFSTIAKAKMIRDSAIRGYALIFLAWVVITVILIALGYKINIFGRWWEIKF